MSHVGTTDVGVLVLHGFTGNPSSMRRLAEAMVALGHHVEMPRLPGHGTTIDDMLDTGWADWSGEVAAAHARLAERVESIVVMGLSMGGALTLWCGFNLPGIAGLVCVNPGDVPPAAGGGRDGRGTRGRRHRDRARRRWRHRRSGGRRDRLRRVAAPRGAVDVERRAGADDRSLRRTDDAAAADHVASGPRRRAGQQRASRGQLRRGGRSRLARAQLPRRHPDYDADDINRRAGEFVARVTAG